MKNFLIISTYFFCSYLTIIAEQFSLIVLPDTQNYVKYPGEEKKFVAQTEWIAKNAAELNVKFVIHEGDITDNNSHEQWKKAKYSIESLLKRDIPFAFCIGNHDIGPQKGQDSLIKEYFPEKSFTDKKYFGGKMPESNCYWYKFDTEKGKFLIISLEFGPSDKMLVWADKIVEKNIDRKVILVTHELLDLEGKLSDKNTKKNASVYGLHIDGSKRNTGEEIWRKHISKHPNYILALCGHYDGVASRSMMKGDKGNIVHILMANYQYSEGGGNGFLRIMKFDEEKNICEVSTYSPYLDTTLDDSKNNFLIKWE